MKDLRHFSGLSSLKTYTFYNCSSIKDIYIPENIESIEENALYGLSSLKAIHIPSIEYWLSISAPWDDSSSSSASPTQNPLYNAHNLYIEEELVTHLTLSYGKKSAFAGIYCDVVELVDPFTVPSAYSLNCMFYNSRIKKLYWNTEAVLSSYGTNSNSPLYDATIDELYLGEGCTLGWFAFERATIGKLFILNPVKLANTSNSSSVFDYAYGASEVHLNTFDDLYSLVQLTTYKSDSSLFKSNEGKLFIKGSLVEELTIGGKTLYAYLLKNCTSIKKLILSENTETVQADAFLGTKSLQSIEVSANNKFFEARENALIEKASAKLIAGISSVPEGVVTIGQKAFFSKKLSSLVMPSSLKKIEASAFHYCKELVSVILNDSCELI